MPVDKFGRMSDTKTRDTGVSLTYINNNYIRSDGTTPVSGSINMNGNTLYNIPDPVNPQDVAIKEYADKKTHIISVNTNYYGPLIKDKYQFTFGENKENTLSSGFVIPHSGRIKKIASRVEVEDTPIKSDDENVLVKSSGIFSDLTGSIFSFHLNRIEEYYIEKSSGRKVKYYGNKKIKLADYIRVVDFRRTDDGQDPISKYHFDNDLENYQVLEGDIINIKTEQDYNRYTHIIDWNFYIDSDIKFSVFSLF